MSVSKNTRKTDGVKATDSNATSLDTAVLVAAIATSEKNSAKSCQDFYAGSKG